MVSQCLVHPWPVNVVKTSLPTMPCPGGGLHSIRHNEIRDLFGGNAGGGLSRNGD